MDDILCAWRVEAFRNSQENLPASESVKWSFSLKGHFKSTYIIRKVTWVHWWFWATWIGIGVSPTGRTRPWWWQSLSRQPHCSKTGRNSSLPLRGHNPAIFNTQPVLNHQAAHERTRETRSSTSCNWKRLKFQRDTSWKGLQLIGTSVARPSLLTL